MNHQQATNTIRSTSNIGIAFIIANAAINIGHGNWWWAAGDTALTILLCANRTAAATVLRPELPPVNPRRFDYNPDGTRKDTT